MKVDINFKKSIKFLPCSPCGNVTNQCVSSVWPVCTEMDVKKIITNKIAYIASKVAAFRKNFSCARIPLGHLIFSVKVLYF